MLPTRDPLWINVTQIESEGIEKNILCTQKRQENGNRNNNIRQHRL